MTAKHPCPFSDSILPHLAKYARGGQRLLDPFAGIGSIGRLREFGFTGEVHVNEMEVEWATRATEFGVPRENIRVGDATRMPFEWLGYFDRVVVSPCYGNRMADHHDAKDGTRRITYRHVLGRKLSENNAGQLQWGSDYRDLHRAAWEQVSFVLSSTGVFVLNISDHIRGGEVMPVSDWHLGCCLGLGFTLLDNVRVPTPRMKYGANRGARVSHENILVFGHPDAEPGTYTALLDRWGVEEGSLL